MSSSAGGRRRKGPPEAPGSIVELVRRAKDYSFRLLGVRARSCREIDERLRRKGYDRAVRARVIRELLERNYLNDTEFARSWVESRLAGRACGRHRIHAELLKKGLAEKVIENILGEMYKEGLETELAEKLARKRLRLVVRFGAAVKRRRLWGYLVRRGFSPETAADVLGRLLGKSTFEEGIERDR